MILAGRDGIIAKELVKNLKEEMFPDKPLFLSLLVMFEVES